MTPIETKFKAEWEKQNKSNKRLGSGQFRYGAGILHWSRSELNALYRNSRDTMTMYGALHPKSDVDRVYMKSKERSRGLISVERCVREEESSLGFYVANSCEDLIRGVAAAGEVRTKGKTEEQGLKQKWNEKRMHGKFVREMP